MQTSAAEKRCCRRPPFSVAVLIRRKGGRPPGSTVWGKADAYWAAILVPCAQREAQLLCSIAPGSGAIFEHAAAELAFKGFIPTGSSGPERDIAGSVAISLDGDLQGFAFVEIVTGNGDLQGSRTTGMYALIHDSYSEL